MSKSHLSLPYKDSQWKIFGMNVEHMAFLVALVSIGLDILVIILSLYTSKWYIAVLAFIFLIINSTVLCTKEKRHRFCYCPYLFTNVFGMLMSLAMILIMIYNFCELPEWWMQWVDPIPVKTLRNDESVNKVVWTTAVLLVLSITYFLLCSFLEYVIWKAYKYMERYPHGEVLQVNSYDQGRLISNVPNKTAGQSILTVNEQQTIYTKKT